MKINMGCGKRNFGPDWVHIDGGDHDHLDHNSVSDLPYDDNTVDLIYASHILEYFDREEVIDLISEWKRVLKPGAVLRLAVPDFKSMIDLYTQGYKLENFLGPIFGKMKMGANTIYHKTVYDYDSLESVLTKCGFEKIRLYNWQNTEHKNFDDHSQAYIPHMDKENGTLISLNVECNNK